MIFLKRNNTPDPWFSVHGTYINPGEIVKLDHITNELDCNAAYPPEIRIQRSKTTGDNYRYTASLCCFDYVGSTK